MVRTRQRQLAPAALRRNKKAWTERWKHIVETRTKRDWATRTAKSALKTPLLALTWGKCAFCEGKLGSQSYTQIEHYISRRVAPQRAFEWKNLFPVCQICNASKGHADHRGRLVKPDAEDPEWFFWIGPEGDIEPHPTLNEADRLRASETIRLCDLNRGGLREDRFTVANLVRRWVVRAAEFVNGLDERTQEEWDELSDPRQSHKIVVRHVLKLQHLPELAEMDRQLFQRGR
jgi:uncharacterized protein (TIGR02646 family)